MTRLSDLAIRLAAEHAGVTVEQMRGESRKRSIAWPRFAAMRALYRMGLSSQTIGNFFGNRDHTSVLHGLKQFGNLPPDLQRLSERIEAELRRVADERTPADPTDTLVAA